MENSNYPHQGDMPSGPYPPDKTWGIVIIVFSVLGICLGGCAVIGGGILGAAGASIAATAPRNGGGAVAAGAAGGMVMLIGILIAVLSAARLYAGILIMNSKRLGFMIAGVTSAISILVSLVGFQASSFVGIAISCVVIWYCWSRINGKMGPPALD